MAPLRPFAALLLAGCALAACTSTSPMLPAEADWPSRQAQLEHLENWQLDGKLAIRTRDSADTARIDWRQDNGQSYLTLTGPAGWGRTTVIADKTSIVLEKGGRQQRLDLSDSAALERELGWDLPAALLPYWIRGIPAPGVTVGEQQLEQGRLARLRQSGWLLQYKAYQQVGPLTLPAQILFEGATASGKIIIKRWILDAAAQ